MNKPTIQDIANSIGVSRVTVWKALSDRPGVSSQLRQQIIDTATSMNYFRSRIVPTVEQSSKAPTTFCVVTSQTNASVFWTNVIHEIAKELSSLRINLLYLCLPDSWKDENSLPKFLTDGTVKGMIVIGVNQLDMLNKLNELPLAKVFTDIPTTKSMNELTGDLLMFHMQDICCKSVNYILKHVSTHICFIADIINSKINFDRYQGFQQAYKENDLTFNKSYTLTSFESYGLETSIIKFLSTIDPPPEFIICGDDSVSNLVSQYYKNIQAHTPYVGGYDCSNDFLNFGSSYFLPLPVTSYGKRLASQLIYRLYNPLAPIESIYLWATIEQSKLSNVRKNTSSDEK